MPAIFISYRRIDSKAYAGRLFDRLSQHFGADHVFMDIEGGIQRGEDFADALQRAVESVDAMIILIGRQWLTCTGHNGRRRLDQPDDWVRQETAIALRRGILVLPVLVDGANMPDEADLPEDIRALARRQASEISDTRWSYDVSQIVAILGRKLRRSLWRRVPGRLVGTALAALAIAAAGIGFFLWRPLSTPSLSTTAITSTASNASTGAAPSPPPVASRPADPTAPADLSGFWRDDEGALYKVVSDSSGGFDMARIEPPEKDPTYRKIDLHGRDVEIAIGVLPSGTQQERADMELSIDGRFMTGLRKSTQIEDTATNWVLRRADPPQAGSASSAADTSGRSAPQAGYQTFSDPKYTFSYPANEFTFKKISDHSGHDGIEARSVHGNAFIQILTSDSITAESTQSLYDAWIVSCAKSPPPYHVVKPGRIIVSCLQSSGNGDVVYRYKLLGSDVGVTLLMRYPESEKQQWDSVVANIQRSLKLTD
ncbi:toll/interleukin-1 receptor domain-containing protein [Paraburkholderia sp. SIMBA_054]|uniref:toll/interleukin-1 receptor domain-containing protein n=1 Tax=Paraburkholderia sp. SIMBA_054 TaxID=3085795 RepID=UPI00397B009D